MGEKSSRAFLGPSVSGLGLGLTSVPGVQVYSSALVQGQELDDPDQGSSTSALLDILGRVALYCGGYSVYGGMFSLSRSIPTPKL